MALDYQRVIDWLDDRIVNRPGRVVAVFLVVTAVFAVGATQVSTESGTESFAEDVPEQTALEAVDREFEPAFRVRPRPSSSRPARTSSRSAA